MVTDRYDWVLVQIDEVGRAARKIALALLDADEEALASAEVETNALLDELFDHDRIALIDARTAARILRPPPRIRSYARLLAAKSTMVARHADVHGLDDSHSRDLARRALELYLEAAALDPRPEHIERDAIVALRDRDPPVALGARHRQLLADLDGDLA